MYIYRHSPNNVNVHTHGLHIDPAVDTVFIYAEPGETLVYNYEIPLDHSPGLHWYKERERERSIYSYIYIYWLKDIFLNMCALIVYKYCM